MTDVCLASLLQYSDSSCYPLGWIVLVCIEIARTLLSLYYGVRKIPICCNDPGYYGDETDPGLYSEDTGYVLYSQLC